MLRGNERAQAAGRLRVVCAALALAGACALGAMLPAPAFADGGVAFVEAYYMGDAEALSPAPSNIWSVSLHFDKNVGFARDDQDDSFVAENLARFHLYDSTGAEVEGVRFYLGSSHEERQLIYMGIDEWLKPLETYTLVADAGITASNGVDVTDKPYTVTFKTSAACSNGLTVFDMGAAGCAVAVLAAGAVAAGVRRARSTR